MPILQFCIDSLQSPNVRAFLHTIRQSELGTTSDQGYNFLFGSNLGNDVRFHDFRDHPRIHRPFGKTTSSAAGAYQIMEHTWDDDIQPKLHLPDFSPHSQDIACAYLISERDCLQKLMDGHIDEVITGVCNVWASLPGNSYGQSGGHSLQTIKQWYAEEGGTIL